MDGIYLGIPRVHILIPESFCMVEASGIVVFCIVFLVKGALYFIYHVLVGYCLRLLLLVMHKDKRLVAGKENNTGDILICNSFSGHAVIG